MGLKVAKITKKQKLVIWSCLYSNFLKFHADYKYILLLPKNVIEKKLAHYGVERHKNQYKFKLRNFVIL